MGGSCSLAQGWLGRGAAPRRSSRVPVPWSIPAASLALGSSPGSPHGSGGKLAAGEQAGEVSCKLGWSSCKASVAQQGGKQGCLESRGHLRDGETPREGAMAGGTGDAHGYRQGSSSHAASPSVLRPCSHELEQDTIIPARVRQTLPHQLPTWVLVCAIPRGGEGLLQGGTRVSARCCDMRGA